MKHSTVLTNASDNECVYIVQFQEVRSVYQILVAILHAGNVEFVETENNHGGDSCTVQNNDILQTGYYPSFLLSVWFSC